MSAALEVPEGAPAQLLEFFRAHPASKISEAIDELGVPESTAYYALAKLHDQKLIVRVGRWAPARWKLVQQKAAVAGAPAAIMSAPPGTEQEPFIGDGSHYRPTGTLFSRADCQVLGIIGQKGA